MVLVFLGLFSLRIILSDAQLIGLCSFSNLVPVHFHLTDTVLCSIL